MRLARAAMIIRKERLLHQHSKKKEVTTKETFSRDSEQSSIPKSVQSFVEIALNGSDLHADTNNDSKEAIMISQLLHLNTKKKRNQSSTIETPFPLYLGLMIHS